MRSVALAIVFLLACKISSAALVPTKSGTVWEYEVTDEADAGSEPMQSQLRLRIAGTQQFAEKDLLKLETLFGDVVTKTELIAVNDDTIFSFAHTGKDGKMIGFVAPQIIVPAKLRKGTSWDYVDEIADVRVHQHFAVAEIENVSVPAGAFRAYRFHCEESTPISVSIDRWFVRGIGFVKEITTLRSPMGDLLNRRTLQLTRLPVAEAKPAPKKLLLGVSSEPLGRFATEFSNTTANLYARWDGHDLRANAKLRAVWIAEDVGELAPKNYKIDDAVTTITSPQGHGVFTLSRPEDGWAPGTYRVEFYLDEELVESVKVKID